METLPTSNVDDFSNIEALTLPSRSLSNDYFNNHNTSNMEASPSNSTATSVAENSNSATTSSTETSNSDASSSADSFNLLKNMAWTLQLLLLHLEQILLILLQYVACVFQFLMIHLE